MFKKLEKLFLKHGQEVVVDTYFNTQSVHAFIQLMRYKNKIYIDLPQGEIGRRDNGCYLYVGPPECDFTADAALTKIIFNKQVFRVKRAEVVYFGNKPLYIWAVLYRTIKDGEYEKIA